MLLFQLLPYYLAAQISSNDSWIHGPEYTFSGHLKMITSLEQDKGALLGTALYLKLKCRPREPDILRCQMGDAELIKLKPKAYDVYSAENDKNDTFRPFSLIKEDFEIKFSDKSIDSYIIEEAARMPNWGMNMVRLISNQLNIGVDLSNEMVATCKGLENSTVGECEVIYRIDRIPSKDMGNNTPETYPFELKPLEKIGKFADESIEVQKKRNVKECLRCVEPFFGTRYSLGLVMRDAITKMLSSDSKIFISKYKFTSETINESELYDDNRNKLGKVLDHIKLSLDKIAPAKDELPTFNSLKYKELLPEKMEDNTRY